MAQIFAGVDRMAELGVQRRDMVHHLPAAHANHGGKTKSVVQKTCLHLLKLKVTLNIRNLSADVFWNLLGVPLRHLMALLSDHRATALGSWDLLVRHLGRVRHF